MADNVVDVVVQGKDNVSPVFDKVKQAGHGLGGVLGELANGLAVFGLAAQGLGTIVGPAEAFLGKATEIGGEVSKLKRIMGGSAEDASRLRFEFEETGVSSESGVKGLKKFSQALAGIADTSDGVTIPVGKQMKTLLHEIGISADDASGNARSMNDVMGDVGDQFKAMPDGAEKTALALKLFGKSGTDLIPLLNRGREGMADLGKESDKLGLTLSGGQLDALKKQKLAMREMHAAVDGLQLQLGLALTPVMTFAAIKGAELAAMFTTKVVPVIKDVAGWIGDKLAPVFREITGDIGNFADVITSAFPGDINGAADAFNKLPEPLQKVALFLADLKVKIEDALPTMEAIATKAGELALAFATGIGADMLEGFKTAKDIFIEIEPTLKNVASAALDLSVAIADKLKGPLMDVINFLGDHMDQVKEFGLGVILAVVVPAIITWTVATWANAAAHIALAVATVVAYAPMILLAVGVGILVLAIIELIKHHGMIKDVILEVWGTISTFMSEKLGFIVDIAKFAFETVKNEIATAMAVVKDIITIVMALIHCDWSAAWDGIKQLLADVWDGIRTQIAIDIELVKNLIGDAWNVIQWVAAYAWGVLVDTIKGALGIMQGAVVWGLGIVLGFFSDLPGNIGSALAGLSSFMYAAGQDMINAIMDGIDSIAGELWGKVEGIAKSIAEKLNPANWRGSPKGMQNWLPYYFDMGVKNLQTQAPRSLATLDLGRQTSAAMRATVGVDDAASATGRGGDSGITVHIHGDVVGTTRDEAEKSTSHIGWAIATGARARGAW